MELDKIELFSSLNTSEINHIASIARRVHLARGEAVFSEGDFEKNIYIVETGQVEIFKRTPLNGEQTIALMKNGDYFGEMAFFEKAATRSASARTLQTTSLIIIEGPDFEKLIRDYPSISMKLLSTLSHRLRDTNRMITSGTGNNQPRPGPQIKECQLVTIAAAKDGYGKTTFATSLARMLALELNKKVLFLDLDLYYGGGTHLLGVHSPRSIIDIINRHRQEEDKFNLLAESIKLSENLYTIPAPRSFLEAEQVHATDLIKLLKEARKHFDYVITDTGSIFDENLYTILDTSDQIFFMINFSNLATVTDNVRFFHGISKLNYPRERLILLGNSVGPDFSTAKTSRVFPYPVIGGMPKVADFEPQFGKPVYDVNPNSSYCEIMRLLVRNILKETLIRRPAPAKGGILAALFGDNPDSTISHQLIQLHPVAGSSFMPIINSNDVRSQVKYVRYTLLFGYIEEARKNLLSFMEFSQSSAPLCELLGEIFIMEDKKSEALEAFQKAISIDAKQHVALGYLGYLTGVKEKFDQAVAAVKEKIAANPKFLDLLNDYAKILISNENYEEAAVQLDKALKENPRYLEARLNLAHCLSRLGEADKAIIMLLEVETKNPRLFFTLGEIFYSTGRLYLAFKAFSKASALYPAYPGLRPKLSELSSYMRKLEAVIDLHERFVNTSPAFPDLHSKLATFYHLAGKTELATTHFKKALALNPNYQSAAFKLDLMQKDEIIRLAKEKLEEVTPDNADVTQNLKANIIFSSDDQRKFLPEESVLQVKNVRTSKTLQKVINFSQSDSGTIEVDCSPLGLLATQDILLFQIIDVKNSSVLRFAPHYLEKDEISANRCEIALDLEIDKNATDIETLTRFFLVHLCSKQLAETICASSSMRATLINSANGLEAEGFLNPENNEQINFVLNSLKLSAEGIPAVKPGDKLSIKVSDGKAADVFAMEFAVGKTDVQNFCKVVIPQNIVAKAAQAA
ncbi:MAG TPA: cyclic nucleotide-binding domain-containing protein [Candidatus Rifleibacterium sp.]|nr:cyclic nucleotide-binding domain-containing protein [Candidatus Rifleibacterium sp.]